MKKAILFLLVSVMTLSFSACSSDDDDNGGDNNGNVKLTAVFTYEKDGVQHPSVGTALYIFEVTGSTEGWQYDRTTHTFKTSDDKTINSTYSFNTKDKGSVEGYIKDKKSYIYAYEPGIDPSKYGVDKFDTDGKEVTILKVH